MTWGSAPLLLALCGCVSASDTLAREAARQAVNEVVASRFPGIRVEPVTDCIIDNATAGEISRVALDSRGGRAGPATVEIVAEVIARPDTIACLGYEALPILVS